MLGDEPTEGRNVGRSKNRIGTTGLAGSGTETTSAADQLRRSLIAQESKHQRSLLIRDEFQRPANALLGVARDFWPSNSGRENRHGAEPRKHQSRLCGDGFPLIRANSGRKNVASEHGF
jgi:hypothetical protein